MTQLRASTFAHLPSADKSRFVGQAPEDRIKAVSNFGFKERQAGFMVTVMLSGGVCVPRQYARFIGTAYGQNVNAFFDKHPIVALFAAAAIIWSLAFIGTYSGNAFIYFQF